MYTSVDHTYAVCAYGESPYLEECVASVCGQAVRSNVIIATSTPNTHINDIANKYGLQLFVNQESSGIAADWNYAVSNATTSFVTIAHQDDVYLEFYTQSLLAAANSTPNMLIYFTDYGELRNNMPVDENRLLKIKRTMLRPMVKQKNRSSISARRRVLALGSPICCPSVTLNCDMLTQPVFSGEMKCDLDWDAWERISQLAGSFYYDNRILMRHRIHGDSETTHLIADNTRGKEDLQMFRRFWPEPVAHVLNRIYAVSQSSNS